MGRPTTGWRLRRPKGRKTWSVIWSQDGAQREKSTGEQDEARAAERAPLIYAAEVQRVSTRDSRPNRATGDLKRESEQWLESLPGKLSARTIETVVGYMSSHFLKHFPSVDQLTSRGLKDYVDARLQKVRARTVKAELSSLRAWVEWMQERGTISWEVEFPSIGKKVRGTPYEKRRRKAAPPLSEDEIEAVIAATPKHTAKARFVRDRFIFQYETALRPETLVRLKVPDHWQPGDRTLRLTPDVLKTKTEHDIYLPLSRRAIEALERCAPRDGQIFRKWRPEYTVRKAAKKALIANKAAIFTPQHFRSARGTHWLDRGATLTAVQHQMIHKHATTTERYVRASQKTAQAMIDAQDKSGTPDVEELKRQAIKLAELIKKLEAADDD